MQVCDIFHTHTEEHERFSKYQTRVIVSSYDENNSSENNFQNATIQDKDILLSLSDNGIYSN